jgi:hypothetical protein
VDENLGESAGVIGGWQGGWWGQEFGKDRQVVVQGLWVWGTVWIQEGSGRHIYGG